MSASFIPPTRLIFCFSLAATLFGCERYAITLNQQPVYSPPPLYSDFTVADQALRGCIEQTIMDKKVLRVEQLTAVTCRHAGVTSLEGLEHFTSIQQLDVSSNALVDAQILAELPQLKILSIQENTTLRCGTLAKLTQPGLHITAPAHCR